MPRELEIQYMYTCSRFYVKPLLMVWTHLTFVPASKVPRWSFNETIKKQGDP